MPKFLDPTGQTNYGLGVCARCNRKFFLSELMPDPNSNGLMVCERDRDQFDPYRLPARQTENITLPFTRPDESIATNYAGALSDDGIDYIVTEDNEGWVVP